MKNKHYVFKIDESLEQKLKDFERNLSPKEKIIETKTERGTYIIRTELTESISSSKKILLD